MSKMTMPPDLGSLADGEKTPKTHAFDLSFLERLLNASNDKLEALTGVVKWSHSAHGNIQNLMQGMIQIQKRLGAPEPEPDQGNGFTPSKSVAWTPLDEGFLDEGISLSNLRSFGGGGSNDKDIAKLMNDIEEIKLFLQQEAGYGAPSRPVSQGILLHDERGLDENAKWQAEQELADNAKRQAEDAKWQAEQEAADAEIVAEKLLLEKQLIQIKELEMKQKKIEKMIASGEEVDEETRQELEEAIVKMDAAKAEAAKHEAEMLVKISEVEKVQQQAGAAEQSRKLADGIARGVGSASGSAKDRVMSPASTRPPRTGSPSRASVLHQKEGGLGAGSAEAWRQAAMEAREEAEASRLEAQAWKEAAEIYRNGNERPGTTASGRHGTTNRPYSKEGSTRPGSTRTAADGTSISRREIRTGASLATADAGADGAELAPTVGGLMTLPDVEDTFEDPEESTEDMGVKVEAKIMAAVQDVLLTIQQMLNPLGARLSSSERTIMKISKLQTWAEVITDTKGTGAIMANSDSGESEPNKGPLGPINQAGQRRDSDSKNTELTDEFQKVLAELAKKIKTLETQTQPMQSMLGRLEDVTARTLLRMSKIEALVNAPEGADGEIIKKENFNVIDQVSHILSHNVEPLSMRIRSIENMMTAFPTRISEIEEKVFNDNIGVSGTGGGGKGFQQGAGVKLATRITSLENLLGPLHDRWALTEKHARESMLVLDRAKHVIGKNHHHEALIEDLRNKTRALQHEHSTTRALTKDTLEQIWTKIKILSAKAHTHSNTEGNEAEAGGEGFIIDGQIVDIGATEELSALMALNKEVQDDLDAKFRNIITEITTSRDDILREVDARFDSTLTLTTATSHGGIHHDNFPGCTVITSDSIVKVKGKRTHHGYEWVIQQWNGVVGRLCAVHNAPWESLSGQLGIFHTLSVFRDNNLTQDADIDTFRLESEFISHLDEAFRSKADILQLQGVATSVKIVQKELKIILEKLASQEMDTKVLDQIQDRVAEMIRAAAPVENDIVDRIQSLFENKMVNREELQRMLEERLGEMEINGGVGVNSKHDHTHSHNQKSHDRLSPREGERNRDADKNRSLQRGRIAGSVKDMQALSSVADRKELLHAIESVEKQLPGAQDRLATALAARAHCYQTLRCLSCDVLPTNNQSSTNPVASSFLPKAGGKRTERLVNIRTLLENQERSGSPDARKKPAPTGRASPAFLHLGPRSSTSTGGGIIGVNTPRGAPTYKGSGAEVLPPSDVVRQSPLPHISDELVDMNMSLGLHVRSLPQLQPDKQWSPEVARELRKGFNC